MLIDIDQNGFQALEQFPVEAVDLAELKNVPFKIKPKYFEYLYIKKDQVTQKVMYYVVLCEWWLQVNLQHFYLLTLNLSTTSSLYGAQTTCAKDAGHVFIYTAK